MAQMSRWGLSYPFSGNQGIGMVHAEAGTMICGTDEHVQHVL